MNKKLLSCLFSFLFLGFVTVVAQEDNEEDIQAFSNPGFSPTAPQSVFEDGQQIYNSGWEWLHQQPNGNTLRWVKRWDANNWYAVGYGGTFIKTTDAGATWFVQKWLNEGGTTGSNYSLYDAYFFDMNTGVAVGGGGHIVRTTDGGVTWTLIDPYPASTASLYAVDFFNNVGYAAGSTTVDMYKTTDGGLTWTGPILIPTSFNDIHVVNDSTVYACGSSSFYYSTDSGATWTTVSTGTGSTLYAMKFTDAMNGWVCGSPDKPAYTTDGGLTWTLAATSPTTNTQYDIDVVNPAPEAMTTVYPMSVPLWTGTTDGSTKTDSSEVRGYNTEDGWFMFDISSIPDGSTIDSIRFYGYVNATNWPWWSATPLPGLDPRTATASDLKTTIEGNSSSGVAYIYQNESSSFAPGWKNHLLGNTANADFQAALAQDWFAMGMDSRDNNLSYFINWDGWNETNVPYLEVYYTAPAVPTVLVTGDPYYIYATTDMGTTWAPIDFLGLTQPWTGTYYSSDFAAVNDFVTVGAFGLINEVTPTEATTAHTLFIKAGTLYSVWGESSTGRVIAVGAASSTTSFDQAMYSTDGGSTWAISTILDSADLDFNDISMVNSTTGYTVGEDHRVMKTTDGGATWFRVTDPATSTTDLETCFFTDANTGYVFGGTGLGYKTTDGGTTWTPLTTGISGTIYASHFLDANTGYIGGSSGALAKTTDGGTTFSPLTSNMGTSAIYSISMVNSNVGYLSGTAGTVRKTTDGGTTWNTADVGNTSPTLYNIDFKFEDNGMVVGSVGRTYYTTNGGTTWNFENTSMSTIYGLYIERTSPDTSSAYVCGTNAYVMKNKVVIVPVELASFTASVDGNNVTLNWVTATEINNLGFAIERRIEDEQWSEVGFVNGHGTTTEPQSYSFTDEGLASGTYNYRIKQTDFNGSYTYYNLEESVEIGAPLSYDLAQNYPNPFNPVTKIKYSVLKDGFVNITVYNVLGEKVTDIVNSIHKAGRYEVTFDATNFASGMYIYRMESGDFVSVKKMMILK